jgi:vacuolar-type H+-ATPase subunit F/Vma7
MADVLVIVPPDLAEGFRLAGARAWIARSAAEARALLLAALEDSQAGIVGVADVFYAGLDAAASRAIVHRYRPVVVPVPTQAQVGLGGEEGRRAQLQELIRRAIGLRVVLGGGRPVP